MQTLSKLSGNPDVGASRADFFLKGPGLIRNLGMKNVRETFDAKTLFVLIVTLGAVGGDTHSTNNPACESLIRQVQIASFCLSPALIAQAAGPGWWTEGRNSWAV